MAFSDLATSGSGGAKIATQNSIVLTTSAATSAGSLAVLVVACDNFQTTDGDEGAVTSVTDSNGTNVWNKAVEMCNGQGTAQTGATVSIWYSTLRGTIASGGTITANLSNGTSRGATAILAWEFGMAAGSSATVGATNTNVGDGAAMTTSLNATTQNREALRFRAWGGEEELTTAITPTSGWSNVGTAANSGTGGVNTSNIIMRGEYHISTGTGDASAPTGGVTCDWASGYVAFYEVLRVLPGWEPTLPVVPAFRRYKLPQTSIARGADPAPAAPYIDWNWPQTAALTRPAATVIGQGLAASVGPGNIPSVFAQWVNAGWPIQPPQPPREPGPRLFGAQLPSAINIDAVYSQWVNDGWKIQPPQPPRQPAAKQASGQLPGPANVAAVFSQWVNGGWQSQPPQPPAFRRYQGLPEFTWRYDPQPPAAVTVNWGFDPFPVQPKYRQRYIGPVKLPASGPAPPTLEWGFAPNNPQPPEPATMLRAGGVLNAWRNVEAVYVFVQDGGVTFGWDPPPFAPPARTGRRLAGTIGPLNVPSPYVQWINTGWATLPQPLVRQPTTRHVATPLNIEAVFVPWINAGWDPDLPQPLSRRPLTRQAAAALPDAANITSIFQSWRNLGWGSQAPQPPAFRRYQALPEFTWRYDAEPAVTTVGWGFDPFLVQPRYRQRYIGPVRLPSAGPAPPTLEWGFVPNNPQPPVPSAMLRAGGVLNAWRNAEDVYLFVQAGAVTFGWQTEPTLLPATTRRPERAAGLLPNATNVVAPFSPFIAYGWPAELPRLPHPKPERAGAVLRGDDGVEGQFSYFLGYGWQPQPPQPPRPRWERAAASLRAAVNIDPRFENWINTGWTPVLPTIPAFRRLFAMPELSWRADQITPVPYEWGFQPATPEGLRTWFGRAAAIMSGANIEAPLFSFLPSGWQQIGGWTPPAFRRYPAPNTATVRGFSPGDLFVVPYEWGFEPTLHNLPRQRWERSAASLPAQLNLPDPYVFVQAVLPPWVAQVPLVLARPRLFLGGIASKSQFAAFDFFPLYGWQTQPPQPPMPRWRQIAGMAVGDNIEGPLQGFQPYGWDPIDARPLVRPGDRRWPAGALSGGANIAPPFVRWINGGWEADLPSPLLRQPLVRQGAAALPGPPNIEIVYQPWTNRGWQVEPSLLRTRRPESSAGILPSGDNIEGPFERFLAYGWPAELPRLPHPRPERAGAIQRGDDGTEATFEAFRPYGWEIPSPQPPRRRWENSAAAGRFAADIPPRFENWVNLGWTPTLPTLPAFRRYFPMPELTWRSDPIFTFFVVPYEWGFEPTLPEGLRTWFARAAGIMPGANIEAPLFGFLPGGWASQYTDFLSRPLRRFPVEAQTLAPAPAIAWINDGWESVLPLLARDPATRLMGGALPAALNIEPRFEAFLPHGWQVLPPHLRHPRPEAGGSILIGEPSIEGPFSLFLPYGWQAQPVQPPHGKWDKAAAVLRGIDGSDARFENWVNTGWLPVLPTLPAFRRIFAMPEFASRLDTEAEAVVLVPYNWGFQPITPDALRSWAIRAAAIMPGVNIESAYQQWRNLGWGAQPFQPPRRPWEKLSGAIMRGANIEAKYEQWRNQGWVPTLPMLRIVRRAIDLSHFTWRTDTFGPVAHEWGFVPTLPAALRNWYLRAAAIEAINRPYDEFVFVEGVTTEFLQTYFIANMQRMMNRRG